MSIENSPLTRREILQARAQLNAQIRAFFSQKEVMEVETPIFSRAGNPDPSMSSLRADFRQHDNQQSILRYAHTSPEFAMKRLLTEGMGSIYQICRVFRTGELGRIHQPEFTMLEWYRPGMSYLQLMDEIEELLRNLAISHTCQRISYADLFQRYLGLDVLNASVVELINCAKLHKLNVSGFADNYDDWCNLLLSHLIEPKIKNSGALFVYDYPASQAALAKIREDNNPVAERFELYIDGLEIANGYQELTNAEEYKKRFVLDNKKRIENGSDSIVIDDNLLNALKSEFPECAGVAVGVDRLLMCKLNLTEINSTMTFDFHNA